MTTIGTPHYFVTYKLSDGSLVNVNIMDTNGQERYRSLNLGYYRKADCCLLIYDIADYKSFNECKNYYNEQLMKNCKKDIEVILLGNKSDLKKERKVLPEEAAGFALENNYIFMETSCVKNENVASAFEALIELTNIEIKKNQYKNKDEDKNKKKDKKKKKEEKEKKNKKKEEKKKNKKKEEDKLKNIKIEEDMDKGEEKEKEEIRESKFKLDIDKAGKNKKPDKCNC